MNNQKFFSVQDEVNGKQLDDYLLEQLATVPKGSRFDGVTNMFDAVVKIYDVATEDERAEMHPFFKMFHDMANGLNTVSIDSEGGEQSPETEKPRGSDTDAASETVVKLTSNEPTPIGSIANQ